MKKSLVGMLAVFVLMACSTAHAGFTEIYLKSGETVAASGTSPLKLTRLGSRGYVRKTPNSDYVLSVDNYEGYFVFQVDSLVGETNITSGATLSFYFKESLINDGASWTAASKNYIINGMALSGNTKRVERFYPEFSKYLRFYFTSGTSRFSGVTARIVIK